MGIDIQRLTRKTFIRIARKHQRPGSGSTQEFLRGRTTYVNFPDLRPTLEGALWAIVGAAATRLYMPERLTHDLDILILSAQEGEVRRRLEQAGFTPTGRSPTGFPLDVIAFNEPWCKPALTEAQSNRDPKGAPVLPLPYLALMKFRASRAQDLADITRMLGQAPPETLAAVRAVFQRWLPDETEDLESLVFIGQREMASGD